MLTILGPEVSLKMMGKGIDRIWPEEEDGHMTTSSISVTSAELRGALYVGTITISEFHLLAVRFGCFGVMATLDDVAMVWDVPRQAVRRAEVAALRKMGKIPANKKGE